MAGYCGALITLAALAAEDLKDKKISVKKLILFAIAACLCFFVTEGFAWQEFCRRMLPGAVLLILSWISKESIGFGDGVSVVVLGLWTGTFFVLAVLCIGILAAGVYGLVSLIRKRTEPFPFLPFLLFGMEVVLIGI